MKRQLFRFVAALLIVGMTAAQIGCKDYDDDIADLNNRIDDLSGGKIATVEQQLAALQSSLEGLKSIDESISQSISGLESQLATLRQELEALQADEAADAAKIADLESAVAAIENDIDGLTAAQEALQQSIDRINSNLDNYASKAWIADQDFANKEWVEANYATLETVTDLLSDLSDLAGRVAALEGVDFEAMLEGLLDADGVKGIVEAYGYLKSSDLKASLETLGVVFGEDLRQTLMGYCKTSDYYTKQEIDQKFGGYYTQSEIDQKLTQIKTDYTKAINDALKGILGADGDITTDAATMLKNMLDNLTSRLEALEGQIKDLASRIQSLVFVPDYNDGKATVKCYTLGTDKQNNPLPLTDKTVRMTFRVSPADYAARIVEAPEQVSLVMKDVKTRAAEAEATIKGLKLIDAAQGTFEVFATFEAKGEVALALRVYNAPEYDEEGNRTNIGANDRTSEYVTTSTDEIALDKNFALVNAKGQKFDAAYTDGRYAPLTGQKALYFYAQWDKAPVEQLLAGYTPKVEIDKVWYTAAEAETLLGLEEGALEVTVDNTVRHFNDKGVQLAAAQQVLAVEDADNLAIAVSMAKSNMSGFKGYYVRTDHAFAVNGFAFPDAYTTVYRVSNRQVVITYLTGESSLANVYPGHQNWSYDYFKNNGNGNSIVFSEVKINSTSDVKLNDLDLNNLVEKNVTIDGQKVQNVEVSFTPNTSTTITEIAGLKVEATSGEFAWGKTYEFSYVYDQDDADVSVEGSFVLGSKPADIKLAYAASKVSFNSNGIEKTWPLTDLTSLVKGVSAEGEALAYADYFKIGSTAADKDAAFLAAINNNAVWNVIVTRNKGTQNELTLTPANGSGLTIDQLGIHAFISVDDLDAANDAFTFEASIVTEFGTKISFEYTASVVMPEYTLQPGIRLDNNFNAVAPAQLSYDKTANSAATWSIANVDLKQFFAIAAADGGQVDADAEIVYTMVTKDNPQTGVAGTPTIDADNVFAWGTCNQTKLNLTAYVELNGIRVSPVQAFTVTVEDPLAKAIVSTSAVTKMAGVTGTMEVAAWKGLSLKDWKNNEMIDATATAMADVFATVYAEVAGKNQYGRYTIGEYGATALVCGAATYYVEDTASKMQQVASINGVGFDPATGIVTVNANDAQFTRKVRVEIPVSIAYQFGVKKSTAVLEFQN